MQRLRGPGVPAWSRPSASDLALASGLLAVGLVEVLWALGRMTPSALVLLVPLTVPLAWRRVYPATVALIVTAALVVQVPWASARLFDQSFTGFVCVLIASYALGRHGRAPTAVPLLTGCALVVGCAMGWHDQSVVTFVLALVFMATAGVTGRVVAARHELRSLLDRQAEQIRQDTDDEERARVTQVRAQISGEVQDLVRRRVHDMVDRCHAARLLAASDGSRAAAMMGMVEDDGRAALDEIRTMLTMLRSSDPKDPDTRQLSTEAPHEAVAARSLPIRRIELSLLAALVGVAVVETVLAGAYPVVSLSLLAPLFTFAVGARTTGLVAVAGLAVAAATIAAVNLVAGGGSWGDYAFPWVLIALAWSGGRLVREQNDLVAQARSRAATLEHSVQVRATAAASEERLRLARELHDVLAHTLMVMVVQSGAARRSLETGRAGATQAMRVVEDTGRAATTEVGRLLGQGPSGEAPITTEATRPPGLDDIESLVARARSAGLNADLVIEGEPVPVPEGMGLAVYRVVQEALTNVVRHAHAQHVSVSLHYDPAQLRLEVRDDGRAATRTASTPAGHGITGMRERAGVYGGAVLAGPSPTHGFLVQGTFPLARLRREQPA